MSDKKNGEFSTSYTCLSLQLRTLFDSVGGERALSLFDSISHLGESEKEIVINSFQGVVDRILAGEQRLLTAADEERRLFADSVYCEIVSAMREACGIKPSLRKKLEVVQGGRRPRTSRSVIEMKKPRGKRRSDTIRIIN